jgi:predicted RND superfamily exporter protein
METSVILNIVFIGLVGLGFICYQIWVGFKLFKTNNKLRKTISEIEKNSNYHDEINKVLESNFNQGDEELRKAIDRLDSRLDGKSKEIYDNLDTSINNINNRMDESLNVVHSRLDENLDKLKVFKIK